MLKKATKRTLALALTATLLFSMLAGCAQPAPATSGTPAASTLYTPGVYTATAKGNNGDVTVEVTCDGDAIKSVVVTDHKETAGISDPALERIPGAIVDGQTLAVDAIAGCTVTSKAILTAVEECLRSAGGDIDALKVAKEKTQTEAKSVEMTADLLVLGAGGAGMSAATVAGEQGASVIVVEKASVAGGNTILAGGGYNAVDPERQALIDLPDSQLEEVRRILAVEPKSDLHKELQATVQKQLDDYLSAGHKYIFDSVEFHTLQTYDGGDYVGNLPLIQITCARAAESVGWMSDYGLKWKDEVTTYVGALWPRSHEVQEYKSGLGFINIFLDTIEKKDLPVEILYEVRADSLIVEDGKVVGATAKGNDGTEYTFRANKGVLLATGGFAANPEMRVKYNTKWPDVGPSKPSTNTPFITGDGIIMAEAIGANLVDMEMIQLVPTADPLNGAAGGYVGNGASLYINKEGVRFVSEMARRDVLSTAIMEQTDGIYYLITNEKNAGLDKDGVNRFGNKIDDLLASGQVVKGETIEELAKNLGLDPAVVKDTVDKWNKMCKDNNDPEFGRTIFMENVWLDEGPYYASPRTPSIHHTMGGVQVDVNLHVLDTKGQIIPGLFAAGEVVGGVHGSNRLGANAIPDALSNGHAAALIALEEAK